MPGDASSAEGRIIGALAVTFGIEEDNDELLTALVQRWRAGDFVVSSLFATDENGELITTSMVVTVRSVLYRLPGAEAGEPLCVIPWQELGIEVADVEAFARGEQPLARTLAISDADAEFFAEQLDEIEDVDGWT